MKSSIILALNLLTKKLLMNCIMILQTTITILLLSLIIGRIQMTYKTADIADTFTGLNAYYFMRYQYISPSLDIADVLKQNGVIDFAMGEIGNLGFIGVNDTHISAMGYNDTIIESCNLKLSKGTWFTDSRCENTPAIAVNDIYDVGDIITVKNSFDNNEYTLEVIGCLKNDEYVISFDRSASRGASSVQHFISNPRVDLIVPFSSETYNSISKTTNADFTRIENSLATLILPNIMYTDEDIVGVLSQFGHITNIDNMLTNYEKSVQFEIMIFATLCIVFTLLTLVGLGGNNGIQSMLNEHQYIIYYMLGATQRKCVFIEATRAFLIILFSYIFALSISFLLPSVFAVTTTGNSNTIKWVIILLYLTLIFLLTSGVFLYQLGKRNLSAKYKEKA